MLQSLEKAAEWPRTRKIAFWLLYGASTAYLVVLAILIAGLIDLLTPSEIERWNEAPLASVALLIAVVAAVIAGFVGLGYRQRRYQLSAITIAFAIIYILWLVVQGIAQ